MDNMLAPILGEVDIRLLVCIIAVLVILLIVALVKKAVKLAIVIGLACLLVAYGIPMAKSFQEKYKFEVSSGVATVTIDGHEIELDKEYISSINLVNNGDGTWRAQFNSDDGSSNLEIPQFMYEGIKQFASKYDIPVEIRE